MVLVATQVKRRRGTTAENDAFTGAEGEIVVDTERHELRVHDGVTQGGHRLYTQAEVDEIVSTISFPAGMIAPFAGTAIPEGWLLCDGSAISRTDYADLFDAIGTIYGAGDGNSTFNLPPSSIIPLGTTAPVLTNNGNTIQAGAPALSWVNVSDGKIITNSLNTIGLYSSKPGTNKSLTIRYGADGVPPVSYSEMAPQNLYADLTQATGSSAKNIIKY